MTDADDRAARTAADLAAHRLDLDTVSGPASPLPSGDGGTVYLYAGRPGPEPRCICRAPWVDGRCAVAGDVLLAAAVIGCTRRTPFEWAAYLTPLRGRALTEGRPDVINFIDSVLDRAPALSPATADGSVRSPCLPVAAGEAWVAERRTPIPADRDAPLAGFRYAGAVGTRRTGDRALDERQAFPAAHLLDPEPDDVFALGDPRYAMPRIRDRDSIEVEWHDLSLLDEWMREHGGREFVLVVDDHETGARLAAGRVQQHEPGHPHFDRDRCARIRATYSLYPNSAGERWRMWAPNAAAAG